MGRFTGILGILTMLGLAFAFSTNRRAIRVKTVAWGLGLQAAFAVFVLKADIGRRVFQKAGDAVNRLLSYAFAGSSFVFGDLGKQGSHLGFYFAFQVLPTVIFIAAFFAVLYHYGVMQFIIKQVARVMTSFMGASGAESLNVAASIFMGQTEAPLTIRPFLPDLTRSELMTVMTSGMAHVSGGIMAAYIAFGIEPKHLLSAVIMTAPGTILISKMLVPETEQPKTAGRVVMNEKEVEAEKHENVLGAIARGTTDGLNLALNIAAMLISFLALIALSNGILGGIHNALAHFGFLWFPSSLERIFGTAERTGGVLVAWDSKSSPRSPLLHDCHLRVVRVRELKFHWDSDRRNRCARAKQERGTGASRSTSHVGGNHGEPDVGFHRRNADIARRRDCHD